MYRIVCALAVFVLMGCTGSRPVPVTACSAHPGSMACEVERYGNAGG